MPSVLQCAVMAGALLIAGAICAMHWTQGTQPTRPAVRTQLAWHHSATVALPVVVPAPLAAGAKVSALSVQQWGRVAESLDSFACQVYRPATLYYNRVPKAGSTSLVDLLHKLHPHAMIEPASTYGDLLVMTEAEQKQHVQVVTRLLRDKQEKAGKPAIFHRHARFINFTHFGQPQPTFINLLRNPVARSVR